MKGMNYSSLTATLRRIHQATSKSKSTGIPVKELLDQDRELRRNIQIERVESIERRDFLKSMGVIGLGAGLYGVGQGQSAFAAADNAQPEIAIIGAGAGGMRTAHRLQQFGIPSIVYEASDRIGGRMYSDPDFFSDNRVVEHGGELISTEHNALRNLAHQLNLELEDVNKLSVGDEETYFIDGMLRSEDNLMDVWVDHLYEPFKQALMDAPWQPLGNTQNYNLEHWYYDSTTARDWLTLRLGLHETDWVHRLLMTDLVAEYGSLGSIQDYPEGDRNSAINLLYLLGWNVRSSGGLPLAGTDERFHVVGGNDRVIYRMADELPGDPIETDRKLVAIEPGSNKEYRLVFEKATAECDILVMAMPFGLIREVDIHPSIYNNFSYNKQLAIENCLQADNGKVQMEFDDRHWDMTQVINGREIHQAARAYSNPDGFISTWEGEPGNPSELGILVGYNGGYEGRNLSGKDYFGKASKKDVNRVLAQVEQIWPGIEDKYRNKALVSNWWDNPLSRGAFVSPGTNDMTSWWGAQWETEGNIYFAGEACDVEFWSYMNGAILSGERVAQEIAQR
jgi:monoamine oxidase